DPERFPGAEERPCDDVDSDCDGADFGEGGEFATGARAYATLEEANAAAVDGATAWVCEGTHDVGTVEWGQGGELRAVTSATLRGDGAGPALLVDSAAMTVEGVSLTGGTVGVELRGPSSLTLRDLSIHDNPRGGVHVGTESAHR